MNEFAYRHLGIHPEEQALMLKKLGVSSLEELISQAVPADIRLQEPLQLDPPLTEGQFAEHIADLASNNKIFTSASEWDGTTRLRRLLFSGMCLKIRPGTPPIRLIRLKLRKEDSKRCSIFKP
jgi:hypothetical protein